MKRHFALFAALFGIMMLNAEDYDLKTLTFEDSDYATNNSGETSYWSSLIDDPQYGGILLYGEGGGDYSSMGSVLDYSWCDSNNTWLQSAFPENFGGQKMYWSGGHAISNYWDSDLGNGDYMHQLSVYARGEVGDGQGGHGHNGSDNFCVHYGYKDEYSESIGMSNLPYFEFADGTARTIDHMYINMTTYLANCIANGNDLTSSLGEGEYVKIEATGYTNRGTNTSYAFLAKEDGTVIDGWTKWDLSELGNVTKVEFNMIGSSDNGYGFSQPAYFCYDDVAVRFPKQSQESAPAKKESLSDDNIKTLIVSPYFDEDLWEFVVFLTGDVPEGLNASMESTNLWEYYFAPGTNKTIKVNGMPQNAIITNVSADIKCSMSGSIMTASVSNGDQEFGSLAFCGKFVPGDYGIRVFNDDDPWSYPTAILDFEIFDEEAAKCSNGDLTIYAENLMPEDVDKRYYEDAYIYKYIISYTLEEGSNAESIETVNNDDAYYTLSGMRVTNLTPGIYIHKGKKVVIK